ncbi:N-terminal phage integrase SAM-like domain-containing protein [Kitasatospora sp. NPDC002965]|uniref:N-terminal phage integrase SAM-like domain-containing protein n=1 Tax=Kitasatospora sp. NPDC002965 TaxID=3154775 RepID=UPI0033B61111
MEPNTEGWHREEERKAFAKVPDAIAKPNLPSGGSMVVSCSRLLESPHQVGRVLHHLDSPELTERALAQTSAELAAVEGADLGDLAGRAQQAVLLSREDASPVRIVAADRLLEQNPSGSVELFSAVDPTAAAVAAAHWLATAPEVTAEASGDDPAQVVLEADNIEALPHETPTLVLGLIKDGATPDDVVTGLVRHAMHVADGLLPDPAGLREQLENLEDALTEYADEEADPEDTGLRLTLLDPKLPPATSSKTSSPASTTGGPSTASTTTSTRTKTSATPRTGTTNRPRSTRGAAGTASRSSFATPPPRTASVSSDRAPGGSTPGETRLTCGSPFAAGQERTAGQPVFSWPAGRTVIASRAHTGRERSVRSPLRGDHHSAPSTATAAPSAAPASPTRSTPAPRCGIWFDEKEPRLKPTTMARYRAYAEQGLIPALGTIPLVDLTHQHLQAFVTTQLRRGRGKVTVYRILATLSNTLSNTLSTAVHDGRLARNPTKRLSPQAPADRGADRPLPALHPRHRPPLRRPRRPRPTQLSGPAPWHQNPRPHQQLPAHQQPRTAEPSAPWPMWPGDHNATTS